MKRYLYAIMGMALFIAMIMPAFAPITEPSNTAKQIATFPADYEIKSFTASVDGDIGFNPNGNFKAKFTDKGVIFISSKSDDYKMGIKLPNQTAWSLDKDLPAKSISLNNSIFKFIWKVEDRDKIKNVIIVKNRPTKDIFEFPLVISGNLTLRQEIDDSIWVVNILTNESIFEIERLTAVDANMKKVGIRWNLTKGRLFMQLNKTDWNNAVYPVTIDPTVIDSDWGVWSNNQFGIWTSQDANGDHWVMWGELTGGDLYTFVNRQISGVWQTKAYVIGAGIGPVNMRGASGSGTWNADRTKLYWRFRQQSADSFYFTVLTNLTLWNASSGGWKQNDESTDGGSQINSTISFTMWQDKIVRDSAGNLFTSGAKDSQGYIVFKRQAASPFTWTGQTITGSMSSRGIDIAVDSSDFIHVIYDTPTVVNYKKATSASDISSLAGVSATQIMSIGAASYEVNIMEQTAGKMLAVATVGASTTMYWNYYNGTAWTQGMGGSTVGLGGRTSNKIGAGEYGQLTRDGAGNMYFTFWKNSTAYQILKWDGAVWSNHTSFGMGASNAGGEPSLDMAIPTTAETAGIVYLNMSGTDSLYFDTFSVSAASGDTTAPQYNNNASSFANGTEYVLNRNWGFQINGTFDAKNMIFEANFNNTGALNYTVNNGTADIFFVNFTNILAGTYAYRWYMNDTNTNWNSTANVTYVIIDAIPPTTTIPQWFNESFSLANNTAYNQSNVFGFRINWITLNSSYSVSDVIFETNLTGSALNHTNNSGIPFVQNISDTWYINFTQTQTAGNGTYYYKWHARSSFNNTYNSTDIATYLIGAGLIDIESGIYIMISGFSFIMAFMFFGIGKEEWLKQLKILFLGLCGSFIALELGILYRLAKTDSAYSSISTIMSNVSMAWMVVFTLGIFLLFIYGIKYALELYLPKKKGFKDE